MKRRNFIKNLVISSGVLLIPRTLLSFANEQKLQIVIIGDRNLKYKEMFCEQNAIGGFTSIGWEEEQIIDFSISSDKNIDFNFSSITVNHANPLDNPVIIPQRIKNIFSPKNRYLILCSLYKQEALLSKEIINRLDMKQIDYWFFGTIPMLNPRIAPWAEKLFMKYENNPKISIYNLNELQSEYSNLPFSDAITKCDEKLVRKLNNFYKNSVV